MRVAVDICGEGMSNEVATLYRNSGIALRAGISFADAARLRCAVAVTASSGLDRGIYPTRAKTFVHMPHSLVSLHMVYPAGAFDGYDVLFAVGPHHLAEYDELARLRNLPGEVFRIGYGKLDILRAAGACPVEPDHILLAPSWGPDNLLGRCGVPLITALARRGYRVTVRPHPLVFLERDPILSRLEEVASRFAGIRIESSVHGDDAIFRAALMIGDYSGTGLEFVALRHRPVVSANVGLKIANEDWRSLNTKPVEISLRGRTGPLVEADVDAIVEATANSPRLIEDSVVDEFLFDGEGTCGERAAEQIGKII